MDAIIASLVGVVVGWPLSILTSWRDRHVRKKDERQRQRLSLVREVMRYRLDQPHLIGPLNELPLMFGDDSEVLRLYREILNAWDDHERRTSALTDLVNRLAVLVGLPGSVQISDIQHGMKLAE
ncbi:DUF6680 family protein [Actinomyces sp. oral taxon 414]|uniref:DUF6680 family protein n=1 Tax=Actinomyces sp. oral taxon 414 TaxID=712122 RepID=UPI000A5455BB|nr:DUF6680 family protein [Actinomyces sp. oral taxon 414]